MSGFYPVPSTRSTNLLASTRLIQQLNSDQLGLQRLQNSISTGKRLTTAGEDPSAAQRGQTLERWPETEIIGGPAPKQTAAKFQAITRRISDLRRWVGGVKPDVALSHNSYAQIAAATSLRVPAVTAMDFEHQPANHLAFRLAKTILVPAVLSRGQLRRQGATARKLIAYPGLKEELYLGDFEPDPSVLAKIGLDGRSASRPARTR